MKYKKYSKLWLAFVQIKAEKGYDFSELLDFENEPKKKFDGAWANIIVKASTINEALEILPLGLKEKNFAIEFIDKIENFMSLVEYKEVRKEIIKEADLFLKSSYIFQISDRVFPYKNRK